MIYLEIIQLIDFENNIKLLLWFMGEKWEACVWKSNRMVDWWKTISGKYYKQLDNGQNLSVPFLFVYSYYFPSSEL
jgi:hypothetical protein